MEFVETRVAVFGEKFFRGTLFDTVGVVEWSYGKFGEFVVKWMRKLANEKAECKLWKIKV